MAFQVILKRTTDPETLERVSSEVAAISGAPAEQVRKALETKSISIGKDFSEEKAAELRARFESLGAETVVKDLSTPSATQPATSTPSDNVDASEQPQKTTQGYDDEDEEEEEGVLLTKEEYVKAMNQRADIFYTEKENV
ncbi:hypothetical protein [Chitinivibrio alkaliphilus]|uniref:Uncharacterized protein n=1 Tax=Chitinivibrio alkaliphilus ACht1 TaxID=1313304 RepID=U7D6M3_9BACT|nr:hypothetical protein [Chitinivibrio alkaliphilus]ERP31588.1 hypothetical protein CALK_1451 [Chitinivibrio alkaliphilus ACht1]